MLWRLGNIDCIVDLARFPEAEKSMGDLVVGGGGCWTGKISDAQILWLRLLGGLEFGLDYWRGYRPL